MTSKMLRFLSPTGTVIALVAVLLALAPQPVRAADVRGGESTVIDAGTVVNDDLYVFGATVDIQGTVNGDVISSGSAVTISGTVNGDLAAAAGTIDIPGQVHGSVRATGGNLSITGTVRDDVLVGGGTLEIGPNGSIGRDLLFGGGTLALNGQSGRDVRVGAGDMSLGGRVDGNVRADVGQLTVADGATIGGDLIYSSEQSPTIASGAAISGQTQRLATPDPAQPTTTDRVIGGVVGWLRMFVAMLLVGLPLVLLFPAFSQRASRSLNRAPWPSVGIGVGLLIGVPMLAVVVLIAGIFAGGWWLAPILLGVYAAALVLGYAVAGLFVGRTIGERFGYRGLHPVAYLVMGLVPLLLVGLVPILGWVIGIVAAVAGVGAFSLALWTANHQEAPTASASA